MILKRWLSSWQRAPRPQGPHASLTVGLVADELTRSCLGYECRTLDLTPANFDAVLRRERPDLVFVESAWHGLGDAWKYRIAAYPDHPERNNEALARMLGHARDLGIPTVFWNKEDGVHFERFVASARLADVVLTVDATCVARYRSTIGADARVATLPFAVQPRMHSFDGIDAQRRGACFVGSYGTHVHDRRRGRQDLLLPAAAATLGLTVYDRNSDRRGTHYRYPELPGMRVRGKVAHGRTAAVYKAHLASLNVNTVEDSETMFSRRLIEILACGGLAVSTPALSIERMFKDWCHVVDDADAARDLLQRLARDGYAARDRDMMRGGAEYVLAHHTWSHRIGTVLDAIDRRGG
jgi:spore maturation protein CgeB